VHAIGHAIRLELDVAIEVGPEDRHALMGRQSGERLRRRVTVLVAGTGRDDSHRRPGRVEQSERRRRPRAVMADLEEIDHGDRPTCQQRCLDGGLGIPCQQGREAAVREEQHDRSVVDVTLGKRRGGFGGARIEHRQRRGAIERDSLPGAGDDDGRGGLVRIGQEALEGWVLVRDPGLKDRPDAEAVEHVDEARDVVLVRVREHQQIDMAHEERQVCADAAEGQFGVWTAVDQHRCAARRFDQDRVALADVERGDMQSTVGLRAERDRQQDRDEPRGDRQRSKEAAQHRIATAALRLARRFERREIGAA
jgi:hypothetical protein